MGWGRAGAGGCRRGAVRGRREETARAEGEGTAAPLRLHRPRGAPADGPGAVPRGGGAPPLSPGLAGGSRSPRSTGSGCEVGWRWVQDESGWGGGEDQSPRGRHRREWGCFVGFFFSHLPAQAPSRLTAQLTMPVADRLPVPLQVTEGPQREAGGDRSVMAHPVSAFQAAYISIEVLIALVSVPGNILVIWAVKMNQALRDATFCFIVSLAVADVAVGALVIPLAIIINIGPQTEFYSCLMVACPVLILTESSILALLAIAVDRYLRVKIPVR